jgi:NADH:ubiquinone oxidoreductase subunit F (NADH-binding)
LGLPVLVFIYRFNEAESCGLGDGCFQVSTQMEVIKENLKMAQMRQKSYNDMGTAPRHFEVGDFVYL